MNNIQKDHDDVKGLNHVYEPVRSSSGRIYPSLVRVHIGQSSAFNPWSKKQKRCYQRLLSWCKEAIGRGCQLFRVDLTTASGGDPGMLVRHFQELRRRVEREFGYYIEFFKAETSEGNGVYHMVWAIEGDRAAWIPQGWLSKQWKAIHGAKIVYIRRMKKNKKSVKKVGSYFTIQYFAGQSSLVRISWSWWRARLAIGKGWSFLKSQMMKGFETLTWLGRSQFDRTITYFDMLRAWDEILAKGWCVVGNAVIFISGRSLDIGFK
ncbi:MAG: hypothetical protein ABSH06_17850 [Thermodesulfobacteriota bacterium]